MRTSSFIYASLCAAIMGLSLRKETLETEGFYRGYHDESNGDRIIYVGNESDRLGGLEPLILKCNFDINKVDTRSNDYLKVKGYKNCFGNFATNINQSNPLVETGN